MYLSLHTSTQKVIGTCDSPVVPRKDEQIALGTALFKVLNVCYPIKDGVVERVDLEVVPMNDRAAEHIGALLYQFS